MQTINKQSTKKPWSRAISQPAREFTSTILPIIAGKLPNGLRGTLYRNGPARLERNGMSMGHWFDGDGAILAVNFTDAGVTGIYRYVQTTGYQQETIANKLLYGNYGMTAPGIIWNQWIKPIKNAANTSVLALPDKLLALWEGGKPYSLDLQTLETLREDDLGSLAQEQSYSAHYKQDTKTGEIFNFGVSPGLNATLNIYKSDSTGKIIQTVTHQLQGVPLIHDFVLAGKYLVFFISPVRLKLWPILVGISNYSDCLEWHPELGTQIIVFDRENLSLVCRGETEPWFQWHFANGYVDNNDVLIVNIARYENFQTNQYLREVATGQTHTIAKSTFSQVQLNPLTGKVIKIEKLSNEHCEFPSVAQKNVGQFSDYTYMSGFQSGTNTGEEILNTIASFDHKNGTLTQANLGENFYPSEPIYVHNPNKTEEGWLLTVVYNGNTHSSEVWIFASNRLNEEPICKLGLPSVIPHSFHGTWKSA
ncbi:MAG: carotenoid oxygenase family protein [Cuspidothrix sp.]